MAGEHGASGAVRLDSDLATPIQRTNRILTPPVGSRNDLYLKVLTEIREAERWASKAMVENVVSVIEHRLRVRMADTDVYQELLDLKCDLESMEL